jgi:radical SAM protein with 4Fe4S-binding SPASM domain
MTAGRANLPELPDVVDLAAQLGAEEVFLQRLVCFGEGMATDECAVHGSLTSEDDAIIGEATRRAERTGVSLRTCGRHDPTAMLEPADEPEPWRKCGRAWDSAVVMADGEVVPCCISTFVAPMEEIRMGNLFELGWRNVWYGARFERHRSLLLEGPGPEYCQRCGVDWSL